MSGSGAESGTGGGRAPAPDPARVEALRAALDAGAADFGADLAAALKDQQVRLARAAAGDDLAALAERVARLRAGVAALRPHSLTPRRGLLGLFDGRAGRLRRLRDLFIDRTAEMGPEAEALRAGVAELAGRRAALDALWADSHATLAEAAAHGAALDAWLAERPAPAEDDDPLASLRRQAPALGDAARRSLRRLPLARAIQNADSRLLAEIEDAAAALDRWLTAWTKALGLERRRPRRVRPDPQALEADSARLAAVLDAADRALAHARQRRAEIAARLG